MTSEGLGGPTLSQINVNNKIKFSQANFKVHKSFKFSSEFKYNDVSTKILVFPSKHFGG